MHTHTRAHTCVRTHARARATAVALPPCTHLARPFAGLIAAHPGWAGTVAVLTPYRAQLAALRAAFRGVPLGGGGGGRGQGAVAGSQGGGSSQGRGGAGPAVELSTVDGFQVGRGAGAMQGIGALVVGRSAMPRSFARARPRGRASRRALWPTWSSWRLKHTTPFVMTQPQGREADVVILSCVRAVGAPAQSSSAGDGGGNGVIGFLNDVRCVRPRGPGQRARGPCGASQNACTSRHPCTTAWCCVAAC